MLNVVENGIKNSSHFGLKCDIPNIVNRIKFTKRKHSILFTEEWDSEGGRGELNCKIFPVIEFRWKISISKIFEQIPNAFGCVVSLFSFSILISRSRRWMSTIQFRQINKSNCKFSAIYVYLISWRARLATSKFMQKSFFNRAEQKNDEIEGTKRSEMGW